MKSKYSMKRLAIGHQLPVRLRLQKERKGQVRTEGAVRKLTEIFGERVVKEQNVFERMRSEDRENKDRSRTEESHKKMVPVQNSRTNSQKYPNVAAKRRGEGTNHSD